MKLFLQLVMVTILVSCGPQNKKEINREPAINFKLADLKGNTIDLSSYKGKKIFINFWATWCAPCIREMPSLKRMEEQLKDESIVFFYASNEPLNRMKAFKDKKGLDFNFVHLENSLESLNIYALPTTFIINEAGEIIFRETGSRTWDSTKSIEEIKNLIAKND